VPAGRPSTQMSFRELLIAKFISVRTIETTVFQIAISKRADGDRICQVLVRKYDDPTERSSTLHSVDFMTFEKCSKMYGIEIKELEKN